ncbi:unnamed protein product [Mytilus coruscus]|uniref:B box-type domain-containing protein n=1 Tax=Mytilus coruscus TaxID=42192 RepID=A0A6J8CIR3_MYTCO|nr:unnamed protein product [Mytilus coruscus]
MASKLIGCSVCNQRQITKPSVVWCSECNEGLCEDCREHHSLSNATKNHETVPIAKYIKLPAEVLQVAQFCQIHNEKYELFCRKHDCPCCKKCVETHNKCKDLRNIKSSEAFLEIEVADNIKRMRINREENLASIGEKRKAIKIEVQNFRTKINERLDNLQNDIMKEIKTVEERESKKIRQLLNTLIQKEKEIFKYQGHFENTKQYASEYQSFLALKQIEKYIANEDDFLQSIVKEEHANKIDITCSVDTSLQKFIASMKNFGDVLVNSSPCNITIQKRKLQQAQIIVTHPTRNFDSITLRLKQTIHTSLTNIRGCTFLPDGKMVFSCFNRKEVEVFMPNGSQEFALTNIGRLFDVKKIEIDSPNTGVAFNDGKLIYSARGNGLKMINLCDESIANLTTTEMSNLAYVSKFDDKLFYKNNDNYRVTCCDFHGNTLWTFSDSSVLRFPLGIPVDNDGNVYVVGFLSNKTVKPIDNSYRRMTDWMNNQRWITTERTINF